MSVGYRAISWNPQKRTYDLVIAGSVALYLAVFVGLGLIVHPYATIETLLIRAFATAAFLLLTIVLSIGPLCRLDSHFLPLLYNRRHLGVTTFLLGLTHGIFAIIQFHSQGDRDPLVSLLKSNTRFDSLREFPFQQLGFAALLILFIMAATSHDFWLRNLTAPVWKRIHMAVYIAYALLVAHVALGALQTEPNLLLVALVSASVITVVGLHLAAAFRERRTDEQKLNASRDGYVEVCPVDSIAEDRARIFCLSGERVAVFRYDGKVSALSNVCQHQNGPLGEGRIIDGCVTCPWHGFQYLPDSGASPPPFTEKVPTFNLRVIDDRVWVHPCPNPPGTCVEPSPISRKASA
jgi:methionine sulfoxide reductase heme-binding subunit